MNTSSLLSLARTDFLDDTKATYGWSDETLLAYLNEAEREACIRAELIKDRNYTVTVLNGTAIYDISPKILRVINITLPSVSYALYPIKETYLDEIYPEWRVATGPPQAFIQEGRKIRFYPIPITDETATLYAARLPLSDMTVGGSPEIPEEYHFGLLDWVCHLAYLKQDMETQDLSKATIHEAKFTARFGPRPTARALEARRTPRNMRLRGKEMGF